VDAPAWPSRCCSRRDNACDNGGGNQRNGEYVHCTVNCHKTGLSEMFAGAHLVLAIVS